MRRRIDAIDISPELAAWLAGALAAAPGGLRGADELRGAVADLAAGESGSLMLGLDGEPGTVAPAPAAPTELVRGDLVLYPRARRVTRGGMEIALTPKEFDILLLLASSPGEVFTKEQIYRAVWHDDYLLGQSNIMAFIRKLRKKIEPEPDAPRYILTIWGVGYRFADDL